MLSILLLISYLIIGMSVAMFQIFVDVGMRMFYDIYDSIKYDKKVRESAHKVYRYLFPFRSNTPSHTATFIVFTVIWPLIVLDFMKILFIDVLIEPLIYEKGIPWVKDFMAGLLGNKEEDPDEDDDDDLESFDDEDDD